VLAFLIVGDASAQGDTLLNQPIEVDSGIRDETVSARRTVDWYVHYETKDAYRSGSSHDFFIQLQQRDGRGGWTGRSREFRCPDPSRGQKQSCKIELEYSENRGLPAAVWLRMDGGGDCWDPILLEFYPGSASRSENPDYGSAVVQTDGWEICSDWTRDLEGIPRGNRKWSHSVPRIVPTFSPTGQAIEARDILRTAQFAINDTTVTQPVVRYEEYWEKVTTIEVSETRATEEQLSATLSYTSPETVAGQFGAEIGVAFMTSLSETRAQSESNLSGSRYNWEFDAPPNSVTMRYVEFEVPYKSQVFRSDRGNESRIVRSLNATIRPIGGGRLLQLSDGARVVPWAEIERNYYRYLDVASQQKMLQERQRWIDRGWVTMASASDAPFVPDPTGLGESTPDAQREGGDPTVRPDSQPGPSLNGAFPPVPGYVRIQNRWKPSEYLAVQQGPLVSDPSVQEGWWSAMWTLEPVPGTEFHRFRNRWTGVAIHCEDGPVTAGEIEPGWWSAMWVLEPVPGSSFHRIRNRWKGTYLHTENGRLELGEIEPGWWSAMWVVR